jgi:glycosyltransferase involved in cell wall biosynthesis
VHFTYRPIAGLPRQDRIWARYLQHSLAEWGLEGDDPVLVHCRGQATAAAAATLKRRDPRVRVLLDMRGDPIDEAAGTGLLGRYRRSIARRLLNRAFSGADGLNTVTKHLADVLADRGFPGQKCPHTVIGCCVDTTRFSFDPAIRKTGRHGLGLDDRFVVCYCGGMSHWQRPDAIAETFAAILADMPDAHLLVISRAAQPLIEHLSRVGVDAAHVTTRPAAHNEVASYMMAADVGLLLREDTPTNRVASPVKFAEYLRCGLPIILTPYMADLADLVIDKSVGQTISFPIRSHEAVAAARTIRGWLERDGDDLRGRCSQVAFDRFSWDRNLDRLLDLYHQVIS